MRHLAEVLARNNQVTVVASQPSRYGDNTAAPKCEHRDGYTVHRVWNGQLSSSLGKLSRGAGELIGALWITCVLVFSYRDVDAVLVSSPPVSYLIPGWVLRRLRKIYLVVDVRDLWIDWAEELELFPFEWMIRLLKKFERSVIFNADHLTVATRGFKNILTGRYGIPDERVTVVYNGLDTIMSPASTLDRAETNGKGKENDGRISILYAGNLGPSQNLKALVTGLQQSLSKWQDLNVRIVGDGLQLPALKAVESDRLSVDGRVERSRVAELYAAADAYLLHLADMEVFRNTVPSKIFEYAAYGKPIICGVQGEARELCSRFADCYYFDSDDPVSLQAAIDRFLSPVPPDNEGVERGAREELERSSRAPLWRSVFSGQLAAIER
jgi:glycosyltransferase involved in cell wall biosynthesis